MSKVAIIDIDGVIANSEARFAKAEEAKLAYYREECGITEEEAKESHLVGITKQADSIYWRTAFTPDLVKLDTLIDGTKEALEQIERAGYDLYFLTSRPESMRQATVDWFWSYSSEIQITSNENERLIMKPASQQYVKTLVWKAGVVELLVRLFDCDELLFVDDEPAIYESVAALALPCKCYVTASLQDALTRLEETV